MKVEGLFLVSMTFLVNRAEQLDNKENGLLKYTGTDANKTENPVINYIDTNPNTTINEKPSKTTGPPVNEYSYRCPEGFTFHSKTVELCYLITEAQEFPPQCPYPFTYSMQEVIKEDINDIKGVPVWLMIKRTALEENYFNPFQSIEKDVTYKTDIFDYSEDGNFLGKNCMIFFNGLRLPVDCTQKHKRICAYPYPKGKYCETHFSPNICIGDSLNIENHKCYCQSSELQTSWNILNNIGMHPLFCEKLAQPLEGFQSMLLTNYFPTTFPICWFGLHMLDGEAKWDTSNATVSYTYWAENITNNKSLGALMFKNPDRPYGWVLADGEDKDIGCGICEKNNHHNKNVSIVISYDRKFNDIIIRINNAVEISDYFGEYYTFYCFVGPTTSSLKQRFPSVPLNTIPPGPEFTLKFKNIFTYPVYYWCESFQHPELKHVYSNKILLQNKNYTFSEYAIQVKVRTIKDKDPYVEKLHSKVCLLIRSVIPLPCKSTLRVMKVNNYDHRNSQMDVLLHLTVPRGLSNANVEYQSLEKMLHTALNYSTIVNITSLARSDFCLSSTTNLDNIELHWPQTFIGLTTTSRNICFQSNGNPVTRTCDGDFLHGAVWSDLRGKCRTQSNERVQELQDLLENNKLTPSEISGNLSFISKDTKNVSSIEIHLMSEILKKLQRFDEGVPSDHIVTIVNNIMHYDVNVLKESQTSRNSTDKILASFDELLTKLSLQENNFTISENKLHVQVSDVKLTNITGVLLQGDEEGGFETIPLYGNTSLDIILEEDFVLGAFLPLEVLRELYTCAENISPLKLIMSLFNDHVLFNEGTANYSQVNSRVISILVTTNCTITSPIPVIFKALSSNVLEKQCAHWGYGMDGKMEKNITGRWKQDGAPFTNITQNSYYVVCEYTHLTHFALLMLDPMDTISEEYALALDIITAIGTCLSLSSILIIFVIAATNRRWRSRASNKILLNFSLTLALQMILLFIAGDAVEKDSLWCILAGASLHYTILSEFFWMLVIAILQYRKFVIVFNAPIPHFVAKSCALCWGLPFIPIAVMLAISNESYQKNTHGLCYPTQYFFYVGLLCPVTAIVVVNLFFFFRIIFAVCYRKIQVYGPRENIIKLQVFLAVVLFFLLGISWIFGLASGFGGGIFFAYLFCITATIQGLVIFLFFVVITETSDMFWTKFKRSSKDVRKRKVSCCSNPPTQTSNGKEFKYIHM